MSPHTLRHTGALFYILNCGDWYYGENNYDAMATDGDLTVWNCYGTTKEAAKEMALYRLRIFQEKTR